MYGVCEAPKNVVTKQTVPKHVNFCVYSSKLKFAIVCYSTKKFHLKAQVLLGSDANKIW